MFKSNNSSLRVLKTFHLVNVQEFQQTKFAPVTIVSLVSNTKEWHRYLLIAASVLKEAPRHVIAAFLRASFRKFVQPALLEEMPLLASVRTSMGLWIAHALTSTSRTSLLRLPTSPLTAPASDQIPPNWLATAAPPWMSSPHYRSAQQALRPQSPAKSALSMPLRNLYRANAWVSMFSEQASKWAALSHYLVARVNAPKRMG